MSNKFQHWSEIEDETLLQELEENMCVGRIAYQLFIDNVNIDTIVNKTKLSPTQLLYAIKKYSKLPIPNPINDNLRYTYCILFHFNRQEILREDGVVSYKLLSYCENNCMNVVNSIRIKNELDRLLDGNSCFCDIQIMDDKNKIIKDTVNIRYPFKRRVDIDDLLTH